MTAAPDPFGVDPADLALEVTVRLPGRPTDARYRYQPQLSTFLAELPGLLAAGATVELSALPAGEEERATYSNLVGPADVAADVIRHHEAP